MGKRWQEAQAAQASSPLRQASSSGDGDDGMESNETSAWACVVNRGLQSLLRT